MVLPIKAFTIATMHAEDEMKRKLLNSTEQVESGFHITDEMNISVIIPDQFSPALKGIWSGVSPQCGSFFGLKRNPAIA